MISVPQFGKNVVMRMVGISGMGRSYRSAYLVWMALRFNKPATAPSDLRCLPILKTARFGPRSYLLAGVFGIAIELETSIGAEEGADSGGRLDQSGGRHASQNFPPS